MTRPMKNEIAAGILLVAGFVMAARGQGIIQPLTIENQTPVTNALGQPLRGSNGDPNNSARVEIREVGTGIQPPDPDTGAGHTNNPLFLVSYMGHDVTIPHLGKFSETLSERLPNSTEYFARVFDAPDPAAALYYADSAVFTDPPDYVDSLDVIFQPFKLVSTGQPDIDTDGDGIPDTMENEVTGTLADEWDSDGDGFSDHYELTHPEHLHAKEKDPIEIWLHTPQADGEPHYISWWSIPGLAYRLGYYTAAESPDAYSEVWSGTATETTLEVDVEDVLVDPQGFFRVFAVP